MLFDLLTPPQGPRGRGQKFLTVARLIHVSNSHTKFGSISSRGLGGYSITDRRTDRGNYNISFAFLKKRGDNVCLFVCLLLYIPSQQLWSLRDGQFT